MTQAVLHLPEPENVTKLVGELLDQTVTIEAAETAEMGPTVTGIFASENGDSGIVVFSDIDFANYAGAALALLPVEMVQEGIESRQVSESIMANFREVFNVFGVLLKRKSASPLQLWYVLDLDTNLPEGLPEALARADKRVDYMVKVEGYGEGRLVFAVWP